MLLLSAREEFIFYDLLERHHIGYPNDTKVIKCGVKASVPAIAENINLKKLTRINFYSMQLNYHDVTVVNIH